MLKPHGYKEGKKYPLAFLIHGGPEGAWNDEWGNRWNPQVFAAAGFVGMIFFSNVNRFSFKGYGLNSDYGESYGINGKILMLSTCALK
jgi:hypothetical protein